MVDESVNHPTQAPTDAPVPDPGSSRCVILTGTDGAAPVDLLSGLSKRGVSSRVVAEPADVMVELGKQPAGMLIVMDPAQQTALPDLIEAVTRYHPRTVYWAYESRHPSGKPQLVPFRSRSKPEVVAPKPATTRVELPSEALEDAPSPLGRVQSQVPPERVRSLIVKVQGPAEVGEPLISEEELAMLLGPVPEEPGGTADAGEPGAAR